MSNERLMPQLVMSRFIRDDLPRIFLPEGYIIRHAQPGDESYWVDIINDSFGYSESRSFQSLSRDDCFSYDRVFFVCFQDKPVGTASAWYRTDWGNNTGYLHMVGVMSSHTGKKLGFYISLAAIYHMKLRGDTKCVLQTDDFRVPAIKTYLQLGFRPEKTHESHEQRWLDLCNKHGLSID